MESVPGLLFTPDVITIKEETAILRSLTKEPGRKIFQVHPATEYGWKFMQNTGYVSSNLTTDDWIGVLPESLRLLWMTCVDRGCLPPQAHERDFPDHVLVNTYEPGDGCTSHTDDVDFWTDFVVGVSLGAGCKMRFTAPVTKFEWVARPGLLGQSPAPPHTVDIWIPPRSVYVLTGDARYTWKHEIAFRRHDMVDGVEVARKKRTSITYRMIHPMKLSDDVRAMVLSTLIS